MKAASEIDIQRAILAALAGRRDLRVWRANAGVGLTLDGQRMVRYGVRGQGDLTGVVAGGRRLEIEVKRPGQRQTKEQRLFGEMITRFGGLYVLARSVEDVLAAMPAPRVEGDSAGAEKRDDGHERRVRSVRQ